MLILIDKSTIEKNPNAGNTVSYIRGPVECRFSMKGCAPNEFIASKQILITEYCRYLNGAEYCEGIVNDRSVIDSMREMGADIEINSDSIEVRHLPEPEYFYEYENPVIPCNECGTTILLNDIETEDGGLDGEHTYTICPHCEGIDTFDIQYEPITDALKRL